MKKFLATILAVVYLASTSGATVHMHYCMGKIYSVDFVKKDGCSKCGMQTNGGCCKDEFKVVKLKDSHQLMASQINFDQPIAVLNNNYTSINLVDYNAALNLPINNNSPPNYNSTSLCILNCVFRL